MNAFNVVVALLPENILLAGIVGLIALEVCDAREGTALPTSLLVRIARQQTETVDFSTSNVRGSAVPLYLAGARVDENYPIGPTAGTAFNLTCLSYGGSLDMGLNIDVAAVDQPVLLRNLMEESFDDLVRASQPPAKTKTATKKKPTKKVS